MTDATPVLEVTGLSHAYGAVEVLNNVDFMVEKGQRHALIGPNGAGKTTVFNLVGGRLAAQAGTVRLSGHDITGSSEWNRSRLGIAKTFQHSDLFDGMSAHENVAVAVQSKRGVGGHMWLSTRHFHGVDSRAEELLDIVRLGPRRDELAGNLSHGERRQLEVAVALASEPELLLLDEPVAGMSVEERAAFTAFIGRLPDDVTVMLIEHDMDVVFSLANYVTVLHLGRVLAHGRPADVRDNDLVQQAYLGSTDLGDLFDA